jgi:hypothetical protein
MSKSKEFWLLEFRDGKRQISDFKPTETRFWNQMGKEWVVLENTTQLFSKSVYDQALKERDEAVALIDELIKGISQYVDKCPKAFSNAFIILKKSRDEALEKIAQFKGGKG